MMWQTVRISVVVAICAFGPVQAQQPSTQVAQLASLIRIMNDPAATPGQKKALVGNPYSGIVVIANVRVSESNPSIVFVEAAPDLQTGADDAPLVRMRFEGNTADILELARGKRVRVRGTFKEFSTIRATNWAHFTDLVIEGPG